mmetsp:Transcript_12527/g.18168  ORF Transcript_12527/g.18168 Transcript_12527/m.18168 type:complete len:216 (-) Transcript_12527:43-690(-)
MCTSLTNPGLVTGSVPSLAAPTAAMQAPHLVWPITTISFTCSTVTANSRLPITSESTILPAVTQVNSLPRPWLNMSSGTTRESEQATIPARGSWLSELAFRCWGMFSLMVACFFPFTYATFPDISSFQFSAPSPTGALVGSAGAFLPPPNNPNILSNNYQNSRLFNTSDDVGLFTLDYGQLYARTHNHTQTHAHTHTQKFRSSLIDHGFSHNHSS